MSNLGAMASRAISVILIGGALAVAHTNFAAAASLFGDNAAASAATPSAPDADTTLPENCYVDAQVVRGIRGKAVVLHTYECD